MAGADDNEIGGFVLRTGVSANGDTIDATDTFALNTYSPKEAVAMLSHLREARDWSQERLCKILLRRFDYGWDRIKALTALESFELGEDSSTWTLSLFFATLLDIAPDGFDTFLSSILRHSFAHEEVQEGEEATDPVDLNHQERKELAEWVTLDSLEVVARKAILTSLWDHAQSLGIYQSAPTSPTPPAPAPPKAPVSLTNTRRIETTSEGDDTAAPAFMVQTSRGSLASEDVEDTEDVAGIETTAKTAPALAGPAPTSSTTQEDDVQSPASTSAPVATELPDEAVAAAPTGLDMAGADMVGVDMAGANLQGANFSGANLQDANFKGADLRNTDFSNASMCGANLRGADLRGANLQDADLSGAIMRECRLQDANLKGAIIR